MIVDFFGCPSVSCRELSPLYFQVASVDLMKTQRDDQMRFINRLFFNFLYISVFLICSTTLSLAQENITIQSSKGSDISASVFEGGSVAVILANQSGSNKSSWNQTAKLLQANGATVFIFDYRSTISKIHEDIISVIDVAKKRGATKIFLMGASRGGSASLKAATMTSISGVIALSPHEHPTRSGGSAPKIAEAVSIKAKTLLVVSRSDNPYYKSTLKLDAAIPKSSLIVLKRGHGLELVRKKDVQKAFIDFIKK